MILWRPKRGPVLTWGRGVHLVIGAAIPLAAWARWGDDGLGFGILAVFAGGGVWELLTVRLAGPLGWAHRYGDVVDLGAFALGAVVAGLIGGL